MISKAPRLRFHRRVYILAYWNYIIRYCCCRNVHEEGSLPYLTLCTASVTNPSVLVRETYARLMPGNQFLWRKAVPIESKARWAMYVIDLNMTLSFPGVHPEILSFAQRWKEQYFKIHPKRSSTVDLTIVLGRTLNKALGLG